MRSIPFPPAASATATTLAAAFLLTLAGCAGASAAARETHAQAAPARMPSRAEVAAREQRPDQQVLHVLNRLAYGPRPGEVERTRAMGVDQWIASQLEPARSPDTAVVRYLAAFRSLDKTGAELLDLYPPPGVALARLAQQQRRAAGASGGSMTVTAEDSARIRNQGRASYAFVGEIATSRVGRAVLAERQLDEVMVDFWENHFNVFAGKDRTRYFLPEYDARTIRPHAMGKFRDLLGAVAKSPAMLYYLDNWQSVADSGRPTLRQAPNGPVARAARRRAMEQNPMLQQLATRRRGLNENYARELMELHTLGVDGGYTQQDVIEVARALTGWTLARGANGGEFTFRAQTHDAGEKTILGTRFPAGRGQEEGEQVLDLLARHPSTAKFIATKLARRFVSDTPPASLVARAAETFRRTDGDIRETVRTIVTSPEFFSDAAYRAKVKSPFELVVSTVRAMGASPDATPRLAQLVGRLGQPVFGHQAPNGYPETGDAWMNSGAILNRINFGLAVGAGRVPGIRLASWPAASALVRESRETQVDGVVRELFGGAASPETRQILITGTNPFLQSRASADSLVIDDDSTMMTGGSMTGAAGTDARGRPRNANAARNQGGLARQQRAAGREAVRPGAGAGLAGSIGTLPQLNGLAQIVGLAIGAPEFQRR